MTAVELRVYEYLSRMKNRLNRAVDSVDHCTGLYLQAEAKVLELVMKELMTQDKQKNLDKLPDF